MRKFYFLLIVLLAVGSVSGQNIVFTSAVFKTKLLSASPSNQVAKNLSGMSFKIDANNDGEIQFSEALQVSALNVNGANVLNLDGIENFTALKSLQCRGNLLTSLDISNNLALENLNCGSNNFVTLTISNLPNLNSLVVAPNNVLTELSINNLPSLTEFNLHSSSWDTAPNLVTLDCSNNALTSLKLYYGMDSHDNIKNLNCSNNALTTLDIREVTLHQLDVSHNQLATLQTYYNSLGSIEVLNIAHNNFVEFTVGSPELSDFQFINNPLLTLSVDNYKMNEMLWIADVPTLTTILIGGVNVNELVISNLPALNKLKIYNAYINQPVMMSNLPLLKSIEIFAPTSEFEFSNFNNFTNLFETYDYNASEKFNVQCRKLTLKNIASITSATTGFLVEDLVVENLPNLTNLFIHVNSEQKTVSLSNLPLMQTLTIGDLEYDYENDTCMNLQINDFPSLTHLNIGYVRIESFTYANIPNVTHLNYYGGSCYNTTNQLVFDNLPALLELKVMDGLLDNLTISDLPNLYDLKVNSSELSTFSINNLPELHDLDLSIKWFPGEIPPLPVLSISNFPNLHTFLLEGVTSSFNLNNLPSLHTFIFNYNYMSSIYDLYPINYTFNDLPSLHHLELNEIQTNNLVLNNLPSLDSLKLKEAYIGNTYAFQNLPVKTIVLDHLKNLYNITFSNLGSIKNLSLINFFSYIQTLNLVNIPTLESFTLKGNSSQPSLTNLDLSGYQSLESIVVQYVLSNLTLNDLPNLTTLNTSHNKFTTLNLSNLPSLSSFTSNFNKYVPDLNFTLSNLPSLSFVDLNYNNSYLKKVDFSECPSLSELHLVRFSSGTQFPLNYLNLRNGNSTLELFETSPILSICVDDEAEKELLQNLSPSLENTVFTNYCNFNPAGVFYLFQGNSAFDFNSDGCGSNDFLMPNAKYAVAFEGFTNNFIADESGSYSIPVGEGSFTVAPIFENPNYFAVSPPSVTVSFPDVLSPVDQNFCITPNGVHPDLEIAIVPTTPARPGFNAVYKLMIKNKGNTQQSGSVTLSYNDAVLDFVSANPILTTQATGLLTWDYSNLEPFETREISLTLNVNSPMETPAVNGGDVLNYTATILSPATDDLPLDNIFSFPQTVVNSFDPNDKTCLEGTSITPDMIGTYVHYMIRFENTGTFAAENIVVKDMIDQSKFDISTLIPLNASHDFITRITGNKVEFIFENINLPFNNATNDGYIVFKIKTLPTLVLGDSFSNSASIYFDYNFPIVTDPAVTTFAVLGNEDFEFNKYLTVYPNPVNDLLKITSKQNIELRSMEIYNMIGQVIISVPNANGISSIDVSSLSTGNYFLKVVSDKGTSNVKFIKK